MMELRLFQTVAAIGSIVLVLIVLELVRQRRLTDELIVPWLVIASAPFVGVLWIEPWAALARLLGIVYEPALVLGLGVLLCVTMVLYLTVVVSKLMRRNLVLAQELALLRQRVSSIQPPAGAP